MIETRRLLIRPWRESDRHEYLAHCNTAEVTASLGGPATVEQIDAALRRISQCQEDQGFCLWAVERKSDSRFLGYCGLKLTGLVGTPVENDVEIGWRLRADAWGQGYACEAAGAILDWAWANLQVDRIVAFTIPSNRASWRLMERIKMARCVDLDFLHPSFSEGHPLSEHIAYVAHRPTRHG